MVFTHLAREKITHFDKRIYKQTTFKPVGLWFAKDYEWIEQLYPDGNDEPICNFYKLEIDMRNILIIDTYEKLINFYKKYRIFEYGFYHINWTQVSNDYQGVYFDNYYEIKNICYFNEMYIELIWFFAIDINSGCLFDISCITKITEINNYVQMNC
jgi:hypothetical protein